MKVEEAIKIINNGVNTFYSVEEAAFYIEYNKLLASNLDVKDEIDYEISSSYYQLDDGILGIRGVSKTHYWDNYDEDKYFYNIGIRSYAFVGEEYPTISYKPATTLNTGPNTKCCKK